MSKIPTIYKFGGASIESAERIQAVCDIILSSKMPMIVVVSAMGKITNALEKVIELKLKGENLLAKKEIDGIKKAQIDIINDLDYKDDELLIEINNIFEEAKNKIDTIQSDDLDFVYDQLICHGELASTTMIAHLLSRHKKTKWIDARKLIATNKTYRAAKVNWPTTQNNITKFCAELFKDFEIGVTQGFIAGHEEFSTSLGREGSDFTASIFGYCLDADKITIWKDVEGILTGDPRIFDNVIKLDRLTYREAIEMTYYGAKVIHPKTIKPLQNKDIPLYVKSFKNPDNSGTLIASGVDINYPPIVVIEKNQCLLHISTKDFSFVAEDHLSELFRLFHEHRLKVNMMRNTAISFTVCVTNQRDRIKQMIKKLEDTFNVVQDRDLELYSIRHFNKGTIENLLKDKVVIFEERIGQTAQMVVRIVPTIRLKQ